jgi:hypothetical protein
MKRFCVMCQDQFAPRDPDQWVCDKPECARDLVELKAAQADVEAQITSQLDPQGELLTEADKARRALGIARNRDNVATRGTTGVSTEAELLQAGSVLAELAGKMTGSDDRYVLTELAMGYLGRARDGLVAQLEGPQRHEAPDLRPVDDLPPRRRRQRGRPAPAGATREGSPDPGGS